MKTCKKLMSLMLVLCMVLSLFTMGIHAEATAEFRATATASVKAEEIGHYPVEFTLENPTETDMEITLAQTAGAPAIVLNYGGTSADNGAISLKAGTQQAVSGYLTVSDLDASCIVTVDVMSGEDVLDTVAIDVLCGGSLIVNGGFETADALWSGAAIDSTASAVGDSSLAIAAGEAVYGKKLALTTGRLYALSFNAKAETAGTKLYAKVADLDVVGLALDVPMTVYNRAALTTEWVSYEYRFLANTSEDAAYVASQLSFVAAGKVWVDEVKLIDCGVSPTDEAVNGDLEDSTTSFSPFWLGPNNNLHGELSTEEAYSGTQSVYTSRAGRLSAGSQFLKPNTTYTFSIWMKGVDDTRSVRFEFVTNQTIADFTLTDQWERYEFTYVTSSDTAAELAFWSNPGVWMDKVTYFESQAASDLKGGGDQAKTFDFADGTQGWSGAADDGALKLAAAEEASYGKNLKLVSGHTYLLRYSAKSDAADTTVYAKVADFEKDTDALATPMSLYSRAALTTEWAQYEYRFTVNPANIAAYNYSVLSFVAGASNVWVDDIILYDCGEAYNEVMDPEIEDVAEGSDSGTMRPFNSWWETIYARFNDNGDKYSGSSCMLILQLSGATTGQPKSVDSQDDEFNRDNTNDATISFWMKASPKNGTTTLNVIMATSDGFNETGTLGTATQTYNLTSQWERYEYTLEKPENFYTFKLNWAIDGNSYSGTWLDMISVVDTQVVSDLTAEDIAAAGPIDEESPMPELPAISAPVESPWTAAAAGYVGAISTNAASYGVLTNDGTNVTLTVTAEEIPLQDMDGVTGNWIGFSVTNVTDADAAQIWITAPDGSVTDLYTAQGGGDSADFYYNIAEDDDKLTYYTIDWNDTDRTYVIIDARDAALEEETGEEEIPVVTITDTGNTLSLDGIVHINQYAAIEGNVTQEFIENNGGLLIWTSEPAEADIATADEVVEGLAYNTQYGDYGQATNGIAAKEFADELYMAIYLECAEGQYTYGPVKEFSVQQYCEKVLAQNKNTKLMNLAVAMLHYGTAAQTYFSYNTADMANANIAEQYPAEAWDDALLDELVPYTTELTATGDVASTAKTLALEGTVLVNYYFQTDADIVSGKLQIWDDNALVLTEANVAEEKEMVFSPAYGGEWVGQSLDFVAKEYGTTAYVRAVLTDSEGNAHTSDIVAFSPEEYANIVIGMNSNAKLVELVKRLAIYGEKAVHYFRTDVEAYFEEEFTPVLRFAVTSDAHLLPSGSPDEDARVAKILPATYGYAQTQEYKAVDGVFYVGDVTDLADTASMEKFFRLATEGVQDDTAVYAVTGNHEFYGDEGNHVERFLAAAGYETVDHHVVINGYHFILLSLLNESTYTAEQQVWLAEQLAEAAAEDPTGKKPIFVMHHRPMTGTVYGANDTTVHEELLDELEQYPQIVDFSAHSHYPISDPRSIRQGAFTALGTGSLSYYGMDIAGAGLSGCEADWEGGYISNWNRQNHNGSMYYIVEVDANNAIRVQRYDLTTDTLLEPWLIPTVGDPAEFVYTDARAETSSTPTFSGVTAADVTIRSLTATTAELRFPQATCPDNVQNYRVEVYQNGQRVKRIYRLSCTFLKPTPKMLTAPLTGLTAGTEYTVKFYAVSSWAKESSPLVYTFTTPES